MSEFDIRVSHDDQLDTKRTIRDLVVAAMCTTIHAKNHQDVIDLWNEMLDGMKNDRSLKDIIFQSAKTEIISGGGNTIDERLIKDAFDEIVRSVTTTIYYTSSEACETCAQEQE